MGGLEWDAERGGVVIDAIHEMCHTYGRQMRRVFLGGYHTENGFHFDGAAPKSVMDDIRKERDGASQGTTHRVFAEVLEGEALMIRRATEGLPEHRLYLLNLHYVLPKRDFPTKRKVQCMCDMFPDRYTSKHHYYDELDRLHVWLAARVPRETEIPDTVATEYPNTFQAAV